MEEIRRASNADRPALEEIWRVCFPHDAPEEIASFFACFADEAAFVRTAGGRPVSMLFLLPVALRSANGEDLSARYVYGVGTLPSFRGRRFAASLIDFAAREAKSDGVEALFLCPAAPSLFSYYSRFGFRDGFDAATVTASREEVIKAAKKEKTDSRRLSRPSLQCRARLDGRGTPYVRWSDAAWRYVGECGADYWEGDGWSLVCASRGKRLEARDRETAGERLGEICAHLCSAYDFEELTLIACPPKGEKGTAQGMVLPLSERAARTDFRPFRLGMTLA